MACLCVCVYVCVYLDRPRTQGSIKTLHLQQYRLTWCTKHCGLRVYPIITSSCLPPTSSARVISLPAVMTLDFSCFSYAKDTNKGLLRGIFKRLVWLR